LRPAAPSPRPALLAFFGVVACDPAKIARARLAEAGAPACAAKKPRTFVTSVIQDMAGRQPHADELAKADAAGFDPVKFVDETLASPLIDDAITRFVGNLFRLSNITPDPDGDGTQEGVLVSELRQEPIVLVTRNRDKPWRYFWQTRDAYCTEATAKLYDYPLRDTAGFVACQLPPERAGFLGLVSVLRSTNLANNPQAFYRTNNNYHRVSAAIYFATGVQLQQNTNGSPGTGRGTPMPACAPTTDMRVAKGGLVFGTAAIPLKGPACASCHSPNMGPLSVAFRRFGPMGELLKLEDADKFAGVDTNATRTSDLKAILAEDGSCWSPDGKSPPSAFHGLAGLGKVISESRTLGRALGVQIPQHLSNTAATDAMIDAIEKSYWARGETLQAALRGYFLSEPYLCEK
jgi:hypothetical protein